MLQKIIDAIEAVLAKVPKGKKALEKFYGDENKARIDKMQELIDLYRKNYDEYHNTKNKK